MPDIQLAEVKLRPVELDDLEALHNMRNDHEVIGGLGGFSIGYPKDNIENWIRSLRGKKDQIIWAIADKTDNRCIGHVGLYNIDYRAGRATTGTLIGDKSYWGRGLGTSVRKAIIDYAFNELNLHKLESIILESNPKSIHITENLGFKREGTIRDYQYRNGQYINAVYMGLLKDEWLETYERK